jgi:hypothetical protein
MAKSYRFIADPADSAAVLTWFRELKEPPREVATAHHVVLYFAHLGALHYAEDGSVDAEKSPTLQSPLLVPPASCYGQSARSISALARSADSIRRFIASLKLLLHGLTAFRASIHYPIETIGIATTSRDQ